MLAIREVLNWYTHSPSSAIALHKFGRRGLEAPRRTERLVRGGIYKVLRPAVEAWSGVTLPREAKIGRNLMIHHRGKVVISADAVIGDDCVLVHGVTLGNRIPGGPAPILHDAVQVGAYAQLLGGITIGDNAKIGAGAIVLSDVLPGQTVVGPQARVVGSSVSRDE